MTLYRARLFSVLAASLALALSLETATPTLAAPRLHPILFALPPTAFPAGSQIVRAGIEGNRRLVKDQAVHFGPPPSVLGRRTGYYMDAIEGDVTASHPYTSYLVSIFRSSRQAQTALDVRWYTWFDSNYYTSPPPAPIALGDRNTEALFHTLDPSLPPECELMFRRGAVLVEVFQGTVSGNPTSDELRSFYAIATALDRVALAHRTGV